MVMTQGLRLAAAGALLGLVGTFVGVIFLLVAVAAFAAFVPARRATRVDPAIALRQQ